MVVSGTTSSGTGQGLFFPAILWLRAVLERYLERYYRPWEYLKFLIRKLQYLLNPNFDFDDRGIVLKATTSSTRSCREPSLFSKGEYK